MDQYSIHGTHNVPLKLWDSAGPFEAGAMQQLRNVASLPFIHRHVAGMPDVHWGKGATVGSVIATKAAIVPAAVGVDIGCGMMAVRTSLGADQLPDSLSAIRAEIERAVPKGFESTQGTNFLKGGWRETPNAISRMWNERFDRRYAAILAKHPKIDGPTAVRYPRGSGPGTIPDKALDTLPVGKGEIRRQGSKVAILAFGSMVSPALQAGETLDATVANMRFIKPLDHALVRELAETHDLLVSIEENALIGGAGSEVARSLEEQGLNTPLLRLGLPDEFIEHGDAPSLLAQHGLDSAGIVATINKALS